MQKRLLPVLALLLAVVRPASGQPVSPDSVNVADSSRVRGGEAWVASPHPDRLAIMPTAIPLRKSRGYFASSWFLVHSVGVGLSDRLSLSGGMFWLPGLALDDAPVWVFPRYTMVRRPDKALAVGAVAARFPEAVTDNPELRTGGLLYGVMTFGDEEGNQSIGVGWPYQGGRLADSPGIVAGMMGRINRRTVLVAEAWVLRTERQQLAAFFGARFFGEQGSVDLFLVGYPVPVITFAFRPS